MVDEVALETPIFKSALSRCNRKIYKRHTQTILYSLLPPTTILCMDSVLHFSQSRFSNAVRCRPQQKIIPHSSFASTFSTRFSNRPLTVIPNTICIMNESPFLCFFFFGPHNTCVASFHIQWKSFLFIIKPTHNNITI